MKNAVEISYNRTTGQFRFYVAPWVIVAICIMFAVIFGPGA